MFDSYSLDSGWDWQADEEVELAEDEIWTPEPSLEEEEYVLREAMDELKDVPLTLSPSRFTEMAFRMPVDVGGGRMELRNFSFEERRHMRRCYDTPAPRVLLMCGRQVEKSTLLGNISLCYSCLVPGFRTLYVAPSGRQADTFSKDRIKEPIDTSPLLSKFTTKMLSQNILEKKFVNRSQITLRYAFLNADRTRGIPAWQIMLDELQDILYNNIPVIEQCASHAPERWKRFIYSGTPKSLDNTIELFWSNNSTQCEWVVPCEACNNWNVLGEENIGKKSLICSKCGRGIFSMHPKSQWAAMQAMGGKVSFEGYRIPQLMVPWRPWADIILDYERYSRARFYNEVLGRSYDSGQRPLTRADIVKNCKPDLLMTAVDRYRELGFGQSIYAGIDWGCHDEETRILTSDGFKYFRDLTAADQVAQWDPATRAMTFVTPKVRTIREWDRPLLRFKTKGGLDLLVTDTHRMRVGVSQGERWLTESAGELARRGGNVKFVGHVTWQGEERAEFVLPGIPRSSGYAGSEDLTISMDVWLEALGYLVSEGGLCFDGDRPSCVKLSQRVTVNPDTAYRMKVVLGKLGLHFSEFPNEKTGDLNWTVYGKQLWSWYADNVGRSSETKRLPRWVLQLGARQLRILFDALVRGDGSLDPRPNCTGGSYYSTSKGLCEDFQELCIRLGLRCAVALHKPAEGNHLARYRANFSEGRDYQFNTPSTSVESVPYSGKVYCCAVPTGYIVTERKGKIAYQGNTGENSYTSLTLGTYVEDRMRAFYWHRFTGREVEPEVQMELIFQLLDYFNVKLIGSDYGGGFHPNSLLRRRYGRQRTWTYQYVGQLKGKVVWDPKLVRFKVRRNDVMGDIFNAIKKGKQVDFPNWEEFQRPYAEDMLNIFSEYNETLKMTQYKHNQDKPDDAFHSLLYMWLVSMLERPRPDIIMPDREGRGGQPLAGYILPPEFLS